MNRFLPVLPLLGALAGTATAAPYVLPHPQPGALTPYDWQPVYALEGLYSIAAKGRMPDTKGLRGSFNLYNTGIGSFRHQFNINVAPAWGNDHVNLGDFLPRVAEGLLYQRSRMELFLMPVTLGYNLNVELAEHIMLYGGGKAGYAWSHGRLKYHGQLADGSAYELRQSMSRGGFTFSVGGGLKVQFSEAVYAHVGYEFGRSYLDYRLEGKHTTYGTHTIFVGAGAQF